MMKNLSIIALFIFALVLAACDPEVPDNNQTNTLRLDEWQQNWTKKYLISRPTIAIGTSIFPYCKAELSGIVSLNDTVFVFGSIHHNAGNYYRFISVDHGQSWQKSNQTIGAGLLKNVSYCGGRRLIAVIESESDIRLALSTNMGANWSYSNLQGNGNTLFSFIDEMTGLMINDAGVFITINGGEYWSLLSNDIFNDLCYSDNGVFIGVKDDGIYTSIDTGHVWQERFASPNIMKSVYVSDSVVFAGGNRGYIVRSTDYGTTWTPKFSLLSLYGSADNAEVLGFVMLDENNGFAAVSNDYIINTGGDLDAVVGILLRTTDGGENWTANYRSEFIKFHDLIALPGPIVIAIGTQEEDFYVNSVYITLTTTLGN